MKIEIKNRYDGDIMFSHECENNTIAITVNKAIKMSANLSAADLSFANLSSVDFSFADLRFANLRSANLRSANLSFVNLSSADLRSADFSFADLRSANLSSAKLSFADLSSANLSAADLRFANLRSANLRSANLSFVNLSSADLSSAITNKKYCSINMIGSAKRMTTYCFEDDIIWCGCFEGSLKEFEKKVKETHANNSQFLKEYLNFIKYIKSIKP